MKTENAIVLVAGEGSRLLPFTLDNPKCLAEISGITILENALNQFALHGVRRVSIVVGHLKERVQEKITSTYKGMAINYIINEEFHTTNSMYSLLLALREQNGPAWILEGDVFFAGQILNLPVQRGFSWFGDSSVKDLDGAFLRADACGKVVALEIIRDLSLLSDGDHKSIGLLHLDEDALQMLLRWLEKGDSEGKSNLYYDLIVAEHLQEYGISLVDVKGLKWFEVDTNEDLANARKLFA